MNELVSFLPQAGVYGVWALVAAVIVALIKGWPALRKMGIEADGALRTDMLLRITELEKEIKELHRQVLILYGALSETLGHLPHDSPSIRRAESALKMSFPTINGDLR